MTAPGPAQKAGAGVEGPDSAVAAVLTRAGVYRLLGAAFAPPSTDGLAEVARTAATLAGASVLGPQMADALRALETAAREADSESVAEEHAFLFHRQVRCPPYEGAYGPLDPMSAGKAATLADVAGFYAAFGLAPAVTQPDVEDHIGAELEFMSALALREAWADVAGHAEGLAVTRAAQISFYRDHLGRWAGTFGRGLRDASPLPYYVAAAEALAGWIAREAAVLGVQPDPIDTLAPLGPAEGDAFTCPLAPDEEVPPAT